MMLGAKLRQHALPPHPQLHCSPPHRYLAADPARSAPRLAFLHQQGLTLPPVPDRNLLLSTDAAFCRWAGGLLGRELGVGEWERWLAEWRATPGGQRWGPQEA